MNFKFKTLKTKEERIEEFKNLSKICEGKIPIICERALKSKIQNLEKSKYLVNGNLTVAQFGMLIRNKLKLEKESAIFLFVKGKKALAGNDTMDVVYQKYKDDDGFLYIAYSEELVWGG